MKAPIENFYEWVKQTPDAPFLRQPYGDTWKVYSYREAFEEAASVAASMHERGLKKGDHVAILSRNCCHWILADIAIMMAGMVSVPLYPTLPPDQIRDILAHADVKALFAGKLEKWDNAALPHGVQLYHFPQYAGCAVIDSGISWDELNCSSASAFKPHTPALDELWTILYTSGTTGKPKGVMHTYRCPATIFDLEMRYGTMGMARLGQYRFFSFLPLNHVAERIAIEMNGMVMGGSISFAENIDTFIQNIVSVQPTFFFAVPRIWMKFQSGVLEKAGEKKLNFLLSLPIVGSLIRKRIRHALGLSSASITLTGAAITPQPVKEWFRRLGIQLREVYGMTEACGPVSLTPFGGWSTGDVGCALPGSDVRVDEGSGEIIFRSPHLMSGYYKDAVATNDMMRDGWIYSGDRGRMDDQGNLFVLGRIKDVFKTSKGVFVAPDPIEEELSKNPIIAQVCVSGLGLPQPIALVNLANHDLDATGLQGTLESHLKEVNRRLSSHEKISNLVICKDIWSEANLMLTPTLKTRRVAINDRYGARFSEWQQSGQSIIWE
ncbi:MAG: AMP-binding protein [Bacteroidota bacterium]